MRAILIIFLMHCFCLEAGGTPAIQLIEAHGRTVNLGSALIIRVIEGEIMVENLSHQKTVEVHYSIDEGSWKKKPAYFKETLPGRTHEVWGFSLESDPIPYGNGEFPASQVSFALKIQSGSETHWDNHGGYQVDYQVSSPGLDPKFSRVILGPQSVILEQTDYRREPWPAYADTLSGTILLRHLGYEKRVRIYYSFDHWYSSYYVDAHFLESMDSELERWQFYTLIPKNQQQVSLYIAYTVSNEEFFDSRQHRNYELSPGSQYDLY